MDVMEHMRKNGKRIMSMKDAVEELRANGLVKAERVTAEGEIVPMSVSAIVAALRTYRLHPDQLLAPAQPFAWPACTLTIAGRSTLHAA